MPDQFRRSDGRRLVTGAPLTAWAAVAVVVAVVATAVLFPSMFVATAVLWGISRDGSGALLRAAAIDAPAFVLLLRTLRTALVIGILATALAWPVAWAVPRRSWWAGLILVPMLLPNYLAYSGWGLLRSPGTWTGDMLSGAAPPPWADEPGYWPLLAGSVLAVAGLTLWAWPLAALILRAGIVRLDPMALDALRLDAPTRWRFRLTVMNMLRGPLAAAVGATALVMLGSAVPLHLAQMQTWAIRLWLLLDQTAADARWTVWAAAWPLVFAVGAVAVGWQRLVARPPEEADHARTRESSPPGVRLAAAGIWAASVVAPAVLFGWFIPGMGAVATFWRVHHGPFLTSIALAIALAAISVLIAAASWFGASAMPSGRKMVVWCGGVMLFAGLLPGVLVGSGTAAAWNASALTRPMLDLPLIVLIGHIARFGFLPVLLGAWLARSESGAERGRRRLDGADGFGGWSRACLPAHWGTILAVGIATGVLGFHEIESAVILQPAGFDGFPRQMLGFLHFARTQELCVGALLTIAVGGVAAIGIAVLGGLTRA